MSIFSETLQRHEKSNFRQRAQSSPSRKSEACIIDIIEPRNFDAAAGGLLGSLWRPHGSHSLRGSWLSLCPGSDFATSIKIAKETVFEVHYWVILTLRIWTERARDAADHNKSFQNREQLKSRMMFALQRDRSAAISSERATIESL
jgi:hypothetical protein